MPALWSALGAAAALGWAAVLLWSDRHPPRRLWPPHEGRWRTAAWAWALTVAIYVGAIRAGFHEAAQPVLPDWLRFGAGGLLSVAGSALHSWGTWDLGLKATSGWPAPLVTRGSYASSRHPQYLGQSAMLIGIALLAGTPPALWPALAGVAALLLAARVEDRHLAATAPGHAAYRARTGFLL
ncbi:methyltransferase [Psychromarinibacter sp. C21-152]|uniref:Methyltransferase n=1 Tax=Psychromarinibacter sediminicola TaxID=3033385 RepID=A0AAE3NLL0_9RHOB|nr:methyltransferase [Psychromarinibacter sediminicola]MDF0599548.1 methyltransferase [Psychromarinibacter sediminicola]